MTTTEISMTKPAAVPAPRKQVRRIRPRAVVRNLLYWIGGGIVAAIVLIPLAYAVFDGFKDNGQLAGSPALLPSTWVFTNYSDLLVSNLFWTWMINSTIVAAVTVCLVVMSSSLAAFVLARMQFKGREAIYTVFTLGLLFPAGVAILPLFILLRSLGLVENPLGVALPQAAYGLPMTIIILRPFFRSIPRELEDASKIDGCSTFGFFWRILLPLARPALATVMVLAIVGSWNAFFIPLLVFGETSQWTLPLGVMNFSNDHSSDWAKILAFTTLSVIPAVLFYILAERQIVSGLTAGSVKG